MSINKINISYKIADASLTTTTYAFGAGALGLCGTVAAATLGDEVLFSLASKFTAISYGIGLPAAAIGSTSAFYNSYATKKMKERIFSGRVLSLIKQHENPVTPPQPS